jgi:hypothetical protein
LVHGTPFRWGLFGGANIFFSFQSVKRLSQYGQHALRRTKPVKSANRSFVRQLWRVTSTAASNVPVSPEQMRPA